MREEKSPGILEDRISCVLSLYDYLTPLQLWYELEEERNETKRASMEEIRKCLESLRDKGRVEKDGERWLLKRPADGVIGRRP